MRDDGAAKVKQICLGLRERVKRVIRSASPFVAPFLR